MNRLRLTEAARAELLHETRYYAAARPGTGERFAQAVAQAMDRIRRTPATGKPDEAGCRRMRIQGFPFSAVYREEPQETVVYAIRPDAREPGYWLPK